MNDPWKHNHDASKPFKAELPAKEQLLELPFVNSPHPSILPVDELLTVCKFRTQSRGGPGGQHRNRTASGVFVVHQPTDIQAEATEQRDQHRNRVVAIRRLRYTLAVALRTASPIRDGAPEIPSAERDVRDHARGSTLKMAEANDLKPAVLALILNDLHVAGGQPSLVAPFWKTSTSRVVALLKSHAPAMVLVNRIREHHGKLPLH